MKLEVGKTYRTRDGNSEFTITKECVSNNKRLFGGYSDDGCEFWWYELGGVGVGKSSDFDLVEEVAQIQRQPRQQQPLRQQQP